MEPVAVSADTYAMVQRDVEGMEGLTADQVLRGLSVCASAATVDSAHDNVPKEHGPLSGHRQGRDEGFGGGLEELSPHRQPGREGLRH